VESRSAPKTASNIPATAIAHALLSYVFGVVIVAGSVNLISGLFR
jgi:uncharacterized membrane protein